MYFPSPPLHIKGWTVVFADSFKNISDIWGDLWYLIEW
jgi:hypothetical protein